MKWSELIMDKQYYINCYNNAIENDRQDYIEAIGNDNDYSCSNIEPYLSVDEVVGYYLEWHKEEALIKWADNLNYLRNKQELNSKFIKEVTNILKGLFN